MKIASCYYKDMPALQVDTGKYAAIILPDQGGKLASFRSHESDFEFLCQAPGEKYLPLTYNGSYVASECSGFDDMFPTIDPYTPREGIFQGKEYNDHGEVCRLAHQVRVLDQAVELTCSSRRFKYTFTRTITTDPSQNLVLRYRIENQAAETFDFIWAAHMMLNGCEDGRIITAYPEGSLVKTMFAGPAGCLTGGETAPLTASQCRLDPCSANGESLKYYFVEKNLIGICAYQYPGLDKTFVMAYERSKVPYLGIWLNSGSFKGLYNIALEPCTAPYDTPRAARELGCGSSIKAHDYYEFDLTLSVQ